jgi:hypothetical protein
LPANKSPPIIDELQQRRYLDKPIVASKNVRGGAAPGILSRAINEPGPHWIHFDVPGSSQKIPFFHRIRGKSSLPQMPPPSFAKIDATCIGAVNFTDRRSEAILRFWNRNQMHMVGHQTVGPNLNIAA